MKQTDRNIASSRTACWVALACLVVPMFASYFFDDMFSSDGTVQTMDSTQEAILSCVYVGDLSYAESFWTCSG